MASIPAIAEVIARFRLYEYPKMPPDDCDNMLTRAWAEDLADLTDDELRAACRAYRKSADPGDRWWPQPGRLIALSATGHAIAHLGSRTDAERAFEDFRARMRALGFDPSRENDARHLDPRDPYRNDAMFTALAAMGGSRAWGERDLTHPLSLKEAREAWIAAYIGARVGHRTDRAAVALTARALTGVTVRMLPMPEGK